MSPDAKQDRGLRIAHILFIDIVGYSKLLSDKQRELFELMNELVRNTEQLRAAEAADELLRLPTGDGFGNPKSPAKIIQARQARRRRLLLWISAIVLFLLSLGLGSWIWARRGALTTAYRVAAADTAGKSIAVLPFENLTVEKENAFFPDGVQNEILSHLAKIADLKVISRTSVLPYSPSNPRNLREI